MRVFKFINACYKGLFAKRRVSIFSAEDNSEQWHIHVSRARLYAAFLSFVIFLLFVLLTLMSYTPILEFLPGYNTQAERLREQMIQSLVRIDSMERMMNDMLTYNDNIALIMAGKSPVVQDIESGSNTPEVSRGESTMLVMPSVEDSILRAQMRDSSSVYALRESVVASKSSVREKIELLRPAEGVVTKEFNLKDGSLGVAIALSANTPVVAVSGGNVVLKLWVAEQGYVVAIQHKDNLLSIYKQLAESQLSLGEYLEAGQMIGTSNLADGPEADMERALEFEIWSRGVPANPRNYIVF